MYEVRTLDGSEWRSRYAPSRRMAYRILLGEIRKRPVTAWMIMTLDGELVMESAQGSGSLSDLLDI